LGGRRATPARRALPAAALTAALLAVLLAVLVVLPAPAEALLRTIPIQELTASAATIVVAEAESARSYRDLAPEPSSGYAGGIFTAVSLRVCSVLKGSAGPTLELTIPGGTVGAQTVSSPDAPWFVPQRTYLVFLDADRRVVGWRNGQPEVSAGRVAGLGLTLRQAAARVRLQTGRAPREVAPLAAGARAATATTGARVATAGARAQRTAPSAAGGARGQETAPSAAAARRTVWDAPVVTAIDPPSAPAGTGSKVSIIGSGFGATTGRVSFFYDKSDGKVIPIDGRVVSWSDTLIRVTVPVAYVGKDRYPGSAATGPVVVTTADGLASDGFQFTVPFGYGGRQWPVRTCTYRVSAGGSAAIEQMVDAAAQTWNAAGALFRFRDGGTSKVTRLLTDGRNDLFWAGGLDSGIIASTWLDTVGAAVLEADIQFNSSIRWGDGSSGTMDVQSIALHEMGHWLNLRDLYGDGDASKVMYGLRGEGEIRRELTPDDIAGIQWVYSSERVDRRRPRATQARAAVVRSGGKVRLRFRIIDPAYSCGAATVTVRVVNGEGRVVLKSSGLTRPTNAWTSVELKAGLRPGRYRWTVQARDLCGHSAARKGLARLTVR